MPKIRTNGSILFVSMTLNMALVIVLIIIVTNQTSTISLSDQDRNEWYVNEVLAQKSLESKHKASAGNKLESARILLGIASAKRTLFPSMNKTMANDNLLIEESMALQQLSLIGKDHVGREYLIMLYGGGVSANDGQDKKDSDEPEESEE